MRRVFTLSLGLALAFTLLAEDALAKSRKPAPTQQPAAESDDFPIPLPKNLTSSKDWLDDGAGNPASGTLQPNKRANDNYYTDQLDFEKNDPTRDTAIGAFWYDR
jgi:hypothetical protein